MSTNSLPLMTVEELWQYPGCAAYSRPEAEGIIQSLSQFAQLAYTVHADSNLTLPPAEIVEKVQNAHQVLADDQ
ncbi:hypothetical protein LGH70_22625 [Hymenobacter sp. BT635]|uniref:Type II toxin-antitoxin system HicB family antitoxin n=1 Tax=Hymenobacter nitidus TaxID=2880929 RepID=A0ABS8AMH2_9BACT|nr:hypothetical protein [Hymenobacter nitidus]